MKLKQILALLFVCVLISQQMPIGVSASATETLAIEIDSYALDGDGAVSNLVADNHVLLLRADSRIFVWGDNTYGQLGLGAAAPTTVYTPTELTWFKDNGLTPVDVAVIEDASFVLCGNAELYAFGKGTNGRLGTGNNNNAKEPTLVADSQSLRFGKLYSGKDFVFAVTDLNNLYAWGRNSKGQLGTGNMVDVNTPTKIMDNANVKQLTLGEDFVTLWKLDNSYWVWGNNEGGRYGFDTSCDLIWRVVSCTSPVSWGACLITHESYSGVKGPTTITTNFDKKISPFKMVNGAEKDFIELLGYLTPALVGTIKSIDETNTIYTYGGTYKQAHAHSDTLATGQTVTVEWSYPLGNAYECFNTGKIHDLQLGNKHGIVNISGTYYGWGANDLKQQGASGNANGYMVPLTQINTFIKDIDNTDEGFNHLVVEGDTGYILTSNGNVYSWGSNTSGKAGLGSTSYIDTPTKISALNGKSISGIVAGRNTAYYISHTGDVYASGDNLYGQTGLGEDYKDTSKVTSPIKVEEFKFSATELPPSAPGSMDHPDEVEAGTEIIIQWSNVSNAAGYELKRYATPRQSAFSLDDSLLFAAEEETELVYNGNGNQFIDTALNEWDNVTYSVKALNSVGDYSPARSSNAINVLYSDTGGGDNNNNNNGNNNNGGGLTDEQLKQILDSLKNNSLSTEQLQLILDSISSKNGGLTDKQLASILRRNSGDVYVTVPDSFLPDEDELISYMEDLIMQYGSGGAASDPYADGTYLDLPNTGGMPIIVFAGLGIVIIAAGAAGFIIFKKRRLPHGRIKVYEKK